MWKVDRMLYYLMRCQQRGIGVVRNSPARKSVIGQRVAECSILRHLGGTEERLDKGRNSQYTYGNKIAGQYGSDRTEFLGNKTVEGTLQQPRTADH